MRDEPFLLDTSIWLEVLPPERGSSSLRDRVDTLLAADQVAITGMVRLELLGGARSQQEWDRLSQLLSGLHPIPAEEEHWQEAARMGFVLRRHGVTVPFTDLLIAAVALISEAVLMHRDHHFDLIASHLPLQVETYVAIG